MSHPTDSNGLFNRFASSAPQEQTSSNGERPQFQRPTLFKTLSNPGKMDNRQRPPFRRAQSIRDKISTETHKFFGVPMPVTPDLESPPSRLEALNNQFEADQKWQRRRFRHLKNSHDIKKEVVAEKLQKRPVFDPCIEMVDQSPSPGTFITDPLATPGSRSLRSSRISDTRFPARLERRDSVARMAYNAMSSLIQGNAFRKPRRRPGFDLGEEPPSQYTSIRERNQLKGAISFASPPAPKKIDDDLDPTIMEFGAPTPRPTDLNLPRVRLESGGFAGLSSFPLDPNLDRKRPPTEASKHTAQTEGRRLGLRQALIDKEKKDSQGPTISKLRAALDNAKQRSWRESNWFKEIFTPRRRNRRNLPIFGKFKRRKSRDPFVIKQLADETFDYRPFFTYWITTVQIFICLFSIFYYGIGTDFTNGFGVIERSGDVFASTLSTLHIVVWEQNNVWIGPRFAHLVHMGAKYTPCMRDDARIFRQIKEERKIEASETGCCIGPDEKCFQTSSCPKQFATFSKWTVSNGRKQPIVCGQDPRFCESPRLYDWTNDTSKWSRCNQKSALIPRRERHMHCEISGRPCCIQMHGQCRITTKEYCDFVSGYYHENATLCSQVSCLNNVCGMTPFLINETPDQFYRFFLPLFIHAGLIRLFITCILQLTIMRRFEIMIGCIRLSLIYFVSGIGGYLASASFVPYMPEVGPAGSQGGVLGALIINVIYNWKYLKNPTRTLFMHILMALFLFATGLLPYIDNWAQLFGFLFGVLMAAALIPYIDFGKGTRLIIVVFTLLITSSLFAFLLILFYGLPVIDIPMLNLLNCPFADSKVCDQQGLILRSWLPI